MKIEGNYVDICINGDRANITGTICTGTEPSSFNFPAEDITKEFTNSMDLADLIEWFDYDVDLVYPNGVFSIDGASEFIKNNLTEKLENQLLDWLEGSYRESREWCDYD